MIRGPRLDGARALDRYLREREISVPAFCESANVDRLAVQRLLSGTSKRPDVDLLLHIASATGEVVNLQSWSAETFRDDAPGEVAGATRADESGDHAHVESTGSDKA